MTVMYICWSKLQISNYKSRNWKYKIVHYHCKRISQRLGRGYFCLYILATFIKNSELFCLSRHLSEF